MPRHHTHKECEMITPPSSPKYLVVQSSINLIKVNVLLDWVTPNQKANYQLHLRPVKTKNFSAEMSIQAVNQIMYLSLWPVTISLHDQECSDWTCFVFSFSATSWETNNWCLTRTSSFNFISCLIPFYPIISWDPNKPHFSPRQELIKLRLAILDQYWHRFGSQQFDK